MITDIKKSENDTALRTVLLYTGSGNETPSDSQDLCHSMCTVLPTEDAAYICKNMPSPHSLIWGIHLCYDIRLDAG
jgi:hypothetical protein